MRSYSNINFTFESAVAEVQYFFPKTEYKIFLPCCHARLPLAVAVLKSLALYIVYGQPHQKDLFPRDSSF